MRIAQPYRVSAEAYFAAGFSPLPAIGKLLQVTGVSGIDGRMTSTLDIQRWIEEYADSNVVLRVPADVVGLDIDAYKGNLENLTELELKLGKLPKTWNADSRGGQGGKILFRVPVTFARWKSEINGITVIQHTHRYILAAPSFNESSQSIVKWYDGLSGTEIIDELPMTSDLPMLPSDWVSELIKLDGYRPTNPRTNNQQNEIFDMLPNGTPCKFMSRQITECGDVLRKSWGSGLHDAGLHVIGRILRAGCNGHHGARTALDELSGIFIGASRNRDLVSEWQSAIAYVAARIDLDELENLDHCAIKLIFPKKDVTRNEDDQMGKLRNAGFSMRQSRLILTGEGSARGSAA